MDPRKCRCLSQESLVVVCASFLGTAVWAFQPSPNIVGPSTALHEAVEALPKEPGSEDSGEFPRASVITTCDFASGGPDACVTNAAAAVAALFPAGLAGCTISSQTFLGHSEAGGTFGGGAGPIGLAAGAILSTGDIFHVRGGPGPNKNTTQSKSQVNKRPGDFDLNILVSPFTTYDRAELSFHINCPAPARTLTFDYTFASEEYLAWKNSRYQDVFAVIIDTLDWALIPSPTCGGPSWYPVCTPKSINLSKQNASCFINNKPIPNPRQTEMDGLTTVLQSESYITVPNTTHSVRLLIADTSDRVFDSAVFIQGSIVAASSAPLTGAMGACCLPQDPCANDITETDCEAVGGAYQGNGTVCSSTVGACIVTLPSGNPDCFQTPAVCCDEAYQGNGTTCPNIGACCQPGGFCSVVIQSSCAGTFQGNGTVCEGDNDGDSVDDVCSQPGACLSLTGDVSGCEENLTQRRCLDAGGQYVGNGSHCEDPPNPTPAISGWGIIVLTVILCAAGGLLTQRVRQMKTHS